VETVDALLADAERLASGPPTVLIVPHAGYTYSGLVAAWAYKQLEGTSYEAIVLIAPSHHARREETISVYARGALQTPLGLVPVDEELASALIAADQRIVSDPAIFAGEHSVEVQLPFLQRMVEKPAIVPVIMSDPSLQNCSSLSQALAKVLAGNPHRGSRLANESTVYFLAMRTDVGVALVAIHYAFDDDHVYLLSIRRYFPNTGGK